MADTGDPLVEIASDLMNSAAGEGARQGRTAAEQLERWAAVGRAICSSPLAVRDRVDAALSGLVPLRELSLAERMIVLAERDAELRERLHRTDVGELLRAEGKSVVAHDDDGILTRYLPDGSSTRFDL